MTFRSIQPFGRLAALALWLDAASLPSAGVAQRLIVRSFSIEDGLANGQIHSILEDRDGFLWIGTWDGVSRFDGVSFTSYDDRNGVPRGRIFAFHQTPEGTLYLAGEGGAAVFDGERFLPLPEESGLANAHLRDIARMPDGTLLFGGDSGLFARRPGGSWETILSPERGPVTALHARRDGTLYIGTEQGLFVMRDGRISPFELDVKAFSLPIIHDFSEGSDGTLYMGTRRDGLAVLRGGSLLQPVSTWGLWIQSIAVGSDGVLYLATGTSGVLRLREATLEPLTPLTAADGLSNSRVRAVHAVSGGPVLFGTDDGLDVFSGEAVETWTRDHGLPDETVWSLAEDERGDLYAATQGGVAVLRGREWRSLGNREGFPEGPAYSVHAGRSGRLYAGDDRARVWISRGGHPLETVQLPVSELWERWVMAILEGPQGEVYAATLGGLAVIRNREVRLFGTGDGLPDRRVFSLAMAADGTLYVGTAGGLAAFRDGAFRVWIREDGLADEWVESVRVARDGSVYAATRSGLSILRDGRFETYDTSDGLSNSFITCTLEDGQGRVYLSTNRGVNVLIPGPPRILPLYGLGLRTGNTGSCYRDHRGRLWFGIQRVLAMYDPAKDRPRHPPKILLTGLQAFKDRISLESRILAHDQSDLTFSFTGIDLAAHFLRFRYRLAGLDREWIDTDQRSVRYPSLLPGDYRFEVQAANDAGLRSAPAGLSFTILPPPWWRRPALVLGLAAAAVALTAGLFAAFRVRQLLEVERLRTGIAADLHDQVGAGLTDIAILSEVASQKTGRLPELDRIAATAREMVDGLGDIVWLVNPRRDSLGELFLRLKDSYAELFAHAGAELEVGDLSPFERVRLPMSWRQDLHLLFQEALRNALRHSGCRRAELSVTLRGRRLEVVLRDDGRGFDPERANGQGEGLATMRRRAGRLKGRLDFESSPAGTTVRFTGPAP
ncbi:MAG TPA: two-component regulator propeller domain-containing protein [Thermoanaerobaculia bacterium]|nr:two-component regulator propeller domain-containing protein [Thermoanaerobaculia bacterium]